MPFIRATSVDDVSIRQLTEAMVDVAGAHSVQVEINKKARVLHINVNGVCLLRVQQIEVLEVTSSAK